MARNNIFIEGAEIIYRNFGGRPTKFNPQGGKRDFCVILDEETATRMMADGWNIKMREARDEGDRPQYYMQVKVNFESKGTPPKVVMITSRGRTTLGGDMVELLDWADLSNVDLIINPWKWEMNGNTGLSGYLEAIYVTIEENRFEKKYADVPEIEFNKPLEIEAGPADDIVVDGEEIYYND
jgi:hypothetical protein